MGLSRHIQDLIAQGEHQQLDFKFEINDAKKIARTLSAFANTDGGKLLIGVKDNGNIAGVRSEEEYHMIEGAAQMYCKPELPFETRKWAIQGKTVLEVDIAAAEHRPCLALSEDNRWLAYVRVKDQNFLANNVLLKVWQKEKRKKGIFIEYSRTEEILLEYLELNPQISISKFCRIGKIPRKRAEETLAKLIALEVIQIEMSEKGAAYRLAP
ncbi:MAG: ATP-binding protein [Bacteroidales bacterium]|nr:ATP-binding protein [Bacteroidales bacterium]